MLRTQLQFLATVRLLSIKRPRAKEGETIRNFTEHGRFFDEGYWLCVAWVVVANAVFLFPAKFSRWSAISLLISGLETDEMLSLNFFCSSMNW